MRIKALLVSLAFLASCHSTPETLETNASTRTATYEYAENYQEIYRRVSTTAKRCVEGPVQFVGNAAMKVDQELYSELGYGEVTYSLSGMLGRNYYWKAKIERDGTGSRLTVAAGGTLVNGVWLERVKGWADGNDKCPAI